MDFANAGVYDITLRVASNLTTDRSFHLEIDGVDVTGIVTFNTGGAGWQTYQDVVVENVVFDAGAQTLRVEMDSGSFNFCLLYTSPSPRDQRGSRMPSSA